MQVQDNIDREKLKILMDMAMLINSNYENLSALLAQIVASAMEVVDADSSSLLTYDSDRNKLKFEVALGPKGLEVKKHILEVKGIAGWVVKNNQGTIINDINADTRFDSTMQAMTEYHNRNMLAVPLRIKGECIGVIEVINKHNNADFTLDDLAVMELFSNQAAIAYFS